MSDDESTAKSVLQQKKEAAWKIQEEVRKRGVKLQDSIFTAEDIDSEDEQEVCKCMNEVILPHKVELDQEDFPDTMKILQDPAKTWPLVKMRHFLNDLHKAVFIDIERIKYLQFKVSMV